jgi:predicted AAA+ superfamily ATPase
MITRKIYHDISDALFQWKTLFLYWPRQSGKTTLVKKLIESYADWARYYTSDFRDQIEWLWTREKRIYDQYLAGVRLLVIDEAQNIPYIWVIIKLIHDAYPSCQVIATWSSSFFLAQKTQEPMTWRFREFFLFPFRIDELYTQRDDYMTKIPMHLVYWLYPEVVTAQNKDYRQEQLYTLAQSYLFKDILQFEGIKKADTIIKLAKMLAFQIWKPVSYGELSNKLWLSIPTVEKYCDILQQAFIIFMIPSRSRNPRKELSKSRKFYFRDVGMRNALIGNYHDIESRNDKGELRENFLFAEYMKQTYMIRYKQSVSFRRSYEEQEVDMIVETQESISWFEIKRKENNSWKIPSQFNKNYPDIPCSLLTLEQSFSRLVDIK